MKKFPLALPQITREDRNAVNNVLKSRYLSRGPVVKEFESEFCTITQSQFACAVSSGTAGLIMALQALNVSPGDEVITVSFTVPATVNSIVAIGAIPVMVDIEPETYGMCPEALIQAITKKSKAIIIVHAFGKSAQIEKITEIAKQHHIKVIEDACEAIGNCYKNKPLGSFADIGVFAFYPNKQITSGEGGMLITNDENLQNKFILLRNHGRSMNGDLYDQISFGWNFRMSEINAALGLSQLKRIDSILQKRQKIAQYYSENLKNCENIICPQFSTQEQNSAWFVFVVKVVKKDRDQMMAELEQSGIQCGRYFAPVHLQPYYLAQFPKLKLTNTEIIAQQCLALPFYQELSEQDVGFISDRLVKSSH